MSHIDNPLIDISDTSNSKKLLSTEFKWHAILNFIQHTPGCHLRKIKKELNISMGTVQYQLNRLEKRGIITSSKRGFYRYYFPIAIKGFDKEILEILAHETLSQIILFVIEQKEPTQSRNSKRGRNLSRVNQLAYATIDRIEYHRRDQRWKVQEIQNNRQPRKMGKHVGFYEKLLSFTLE